MTTPRDEWPLSRRDCKGRSTALLLCAAARGTLTTRSQARAIARTHGSEWSDEAHLATKDEALKILQAAKDEVRRRRMRNAAIEEKQGTSYHGLRHTVVQHMNE